jgi:UDP-N-acetylmuramoyl-L-alanyl-D-glutamate--2,6-diaminopimelate ligase
MQRVDFEFDNAAPQVVVDYAHTPDALEKALRALRPFATERGGKLWSVFGCGGNRDAGKRPLMGKLSQQLADQTVITSDNPRNEAPAFIVLQIVAGLAGSQERVKVIEDRRVAIAHAVRNANPNDVILVAGKGHEDYQDIAGVKHHFSDVEEALIALRARGGASA